MRIKLNEIVISDDPCLNPNLCHWTAINTPLKSEDVSLCGLDISNHPWATPKQRVDCPECIARWKADED